MAHELGGHPPVITRADRSGAGAGLVPGVFMVHKFGSNPTVSSDEAMLGYLQGWSGFLTTASTIRIASGGNANDTAAGSGARSVMVEGLDATGARQGPIEIATNGTSASTSTTETWLRVHRVYVHTSGTYTSTGLNGGNVGQITIETVGGTALAAIAAGRGQSQLCMYTIPLGYTGYLMHIDASVSASGGQTTANVTMYQRRDILTTSGTVRPRRLVEMYNGVGAVDDNRFEGSVSFPALTDVWISATKNGAGTVAIEASFQLELRRSL